MFKFRLCHQALSWPLISSFWFTQEDFNCGKEVCLTRGFSMEVLYLACCFSPFMYQNATLSIWMGQIQQKCTHLYITNFERLKPILAPKLLWTGIWKPTCGGTTVYCRYWSLGPWGSRAGLEDRGPKAVLCSQQPYLSSPMCLTIMIISQVGYEIKKNRKLCLRKIRSAKN